MADFALDPNYKQVPERIADFKALYPKGSLQPADPSKPFWIVEAAGKTFICFAAAAYRTPDDPRPGIGTAWEPFPGKTPYTRDSEVMNAETSAWGRAIVAVLASESKAIASAEDVRNRRADQSVDPMEDSPPGSESARPVRSSKSVSSGGGTPETRLATEKQVRMIRAKLRLKGIQTTQNGYLEGEAVENAWKEAGLQKVDFDSFPFSQVNPALEFIDALPDPT